MLSNLRNSVSLSINTLFCMFLTTCLSSFSCRISFSICCCNLLIPPSRHPITSGIISTWNPSRLSLVSNANCWYLFNFSRCFSSILCSRGQAMSISQISFPTLSSSVRSGLLALLYFLSFYSKCHINLNLSFSITSPFTHCCSYHCVLSCIISCCFRYSTASTINALLCLHTLLLLFHTVRFDELA